MRSFCLRCLILAPFLVLLAGPAWAVVGDVTVLDPNANAVPDATVVIEFDDGTSVTAQEEKDETGAAYYTFDIDDESKAERPVTVVVTKGDQTVTRTGVRLTRSVGDDGTPRYSADVRGVSFAPKPAEAPDRGGPSISVSGGHETVDLPRGMFFRREFGGTITVLPVFEDDDEARGPNTAVDLEVPTLGGLRLGYRFSGASSSSGPVSLNASGETFGLFSPGLGFATGQNLNNITTERDYREHSGRLSFSPWSWGLSNGGRFDPIFGFEGGTMAMDISLNMTIGAATGYRELRWLGNDYYGVLGGGRATQPLGDRTQLYGEGLLNVRYNDANAMWRVEVDGFSPRTQDFSEQKVTVGGDLKAGIEYDLGRLGSLFVEAGSGFFQVPNIVFDDPTLGDGGATLDHEFSVSYRVNAGLRLNLGGF